LVPDRWRSAARPSARRSRFQSNWGEYNAERQFPEILLELEALVDGDENVKLSLPLSDQLGIRQSAPFSLGDGQDVVSGKGLPDSWIDALA